MSPHHRIRGREMAHVCKIMVGAFEGHNGRYADDGEELYDTYNLESGITYAEDLRGAGYTECPVDGFNLAAFEAWCRAALGRS